MSNRSMTKIEGTIEAVLAHRFILVTADRQKHLADLGPEGVGRFPLIVGAAVALEGESKPSELKVLSIATVGGEPVAIERGKLGKPGRDAAGDPRLARSAVESAGFRVLGEPRRKPRHFEVLGAKDGEHVECHVALGGSIRKMKPVEIDDDKWAAELKPAS